MGHKVCTRFAASLSLQARVFAPEAMHCNGTRGVESPLRGTAQVRASHKVVSDAEAPGAAGEMHLGVEKYKGHTKPQEDPDARFRWWGVRFHDWGYVAAIIQFFGACLFSVSVIIALPHVLPAEADTNYWTWDATFWTLQVRRGFGRNWRCCRHCDDCDVCVM